MNIQIQVCGLFIMVLLFVFYMSHRTLRLYAEKLFMGTMCVAIVNLILDIVSIVVIHYRHHLSMLFVHAVCKTYIVSLIWVSVFALAYILTDLYSEREHMLRMKNIGIIALIESIVVYMIPIYIYENGKDVYTYGPATMMVYVSVMIYIFLVIFSICLFHKKMNRRRMFAVALWMSIWIAAAVIQFINNHLLIVGFAGVIGILILFVIMENPEANVDRRTGCFNAHALSEYLVKLYEKKQEFDVLGICFGATANMEEQNLCVQKIISDIDKRSNALIFKNVNSDIVIISGDMGKLCDIGNELCKLMRGIMSSMEDVRATLVPHGECFDDIGDLFGFMNFVRTETANNVGQLCVAEQKMMYKYKERYETEQKITEALAEDRVEVFLQPIYSNKEKSFTSAEALVRIREKDGQLLSPGVFIPVAERSGQIVELGERVVEKVCDFLKNSEAIKYGMRYVEVNLSIIQCEMEELADRLISIVERYQVDPKRINLEITETASISARTILLDNMKKLIDYGFTFSLDDFGKGQSNLMYVVEMPVSIVKLDYDMTKAFFNSSKAKQVVRAVVNMSHGMDLKLVAEGVETKEENDAMHEEGIDYIQGFYYAKPLPMDKFLEYLKRYD